MPRDKDSYQFHKPLTHNEHIKITGVFFSPPLHRSSQCRELLDIVSGGASKDLHEQLYECHRVTAIPVRGDPGYGQCIRDNNLGVFKVGHVMTGPNT